MRLFTDECVYRVTVEALRAWGHEVVTAQEAGLVGKGDDELLEYALEQRRVLLTIDLDFSDIRRYPPGHHHGIIVLKIRPKVVDRVHAVLKKFLEVTPQEELDRALVIVDRNKYRIRRG